MRSKEKQRVTCLNEWITEQGPQRRRGTIKGERVTWSNKRKDVVESHEHTCSEEKCYRKQERKREWGRDLTSGRIKTVIRVGGGMFSTECPLILNIKLVSLVEK